VLQGFNIENIFSLCHSTLDAESGFFIFSGFLLPRLLQKQYFVTLNLFQGLITYRFYEMLKQVQHDIFAYFASSATACSAGMTEKLYPKA